ncbi:MAG: SAM-dependent methyltransferase [Nocardiopsaceae bacterium]|nr:SAM-dependent methyltransferase [Nocardiopsaceae bacterium]
MVEKARLDGEPVPPGLNPAVPSVARVYDYIVGGKDHYAIDRQVADEACSLHPGGLEALRAIALANRQFLANAVDYLAGQGIRQFLDIGTGLPTANNTHEVAQRAAPSSRIVYVDHDPVVLVHARALLTSSPEGVTSYIEADLRDTGTIVREAAATLDFTKPVAIMLIAILHSTVDADNPYQIVRDLMAAVPPGSYLAISHLSKDIPAADEAEAMDIYGRAFTERMPEDSVILRDRAEITRFFDGLELVGPGVVQLDQWQATDGSPGPSKIAGYGGVARKPG